MASFDSKVAIVTGAGSGIGAEIIATGGKAAAFAQNTAKWQDSEAPVAFARDTFGALPLAVDDAGSYHLVDGGYSAH